MMKYSFIFAATLLLSLSAFAQIDTSVQTQYQDCEDIISQGESRDKIKAIFSEEEVNTIKVEACRCTVDKINTYTDFFTLADKSPEQKKQEMQLSTQIISECVQRAADTL